MVWKLRYTLIKIAEYYAKSDDTIYFTKHYDKWEDLCDILRIDGFCLYNEKEIAFVIEQYNNPNSFDEE